MDINTFGVIGAGQMGNGIAQVAATAGLNVIMSDIKIEFAEKGLANIAKILGKNVDKGKISAEDKDAILGRIKITADLKEMADADFGYVGWGEEKIALFVGRMMIAKEIPASEAADRLVELI